MSTTISAGNATNGLAFSADNTGALEFKTGSGAGTTALTLSTSQIATFAGNVISPLGTLYPIVSGTAVASTSGTSIDFTGIPAGVKRITVMFSGVSTNGSSYIRFQLGDSGGVETTGYVGVCGQIGGAAASAASTSGFDSYGDNGAAVLRYGTLVFTLLGSNTWTLCGGYNIATAFQYLFTGSKTLSDTLDRVRITTVNGTDTFDAGSINVSYE